MMRAVIGTLVCGSRQMLDDGRFDWMADMMLTPKIDALFSKWES